MNRTASIGMSIVLAAAVALVATAPASAHDCRAADPARACGDCRSLGYHNHRYNDNSNYCTSIGFAELCDAAGLSCPGLP